MRRKWIIGLGNPGEKYALTRHNLGFRVVDALAADFDTDFRKEKDRAEWAEADIEDLRVILLKPQTFMNLSGEAAALWKKSTVMDPAKDLLIICDDMDLPLGKLRIKPSGSAGSHNGMKSIVERLGTQDFARLRLGVGRPADPAGWADYVLRPFEPAERDAAQAMVLRARDAASAWLGSMDLEKVMTMFNA